MADFRNLIAGAPLLAACLAGWLLPMVQQAEAADPIAACVKAVNDDTIQNYQPAFHDGAVAAFRTLFPNAKETPTDEMLRTNAQFRCMDRRIYVCFVGANLPCVKMNTSRENPGANAFCRENPEVDFVPLAAVGHDSVYSYRCRNGHAQTTGTSYELDARGFAKSLWVPISATR